MALQALAALDVHTAKHIVENCFSGDLVKGRTVILVVRVSRAVLQQNNTYIIYSDPQRGIG